MARAFAISFLHPCVVFDVILPIELTQRLIVEQGLADAARPPAGIDQW